MNYRVITKKWDVQSPALVHEIISPVTKDRLYPSVFGSFTLKGSPLVEMSITDETIYKEFRAASKDFPKEVDIAETVGSNPFTETHRCRSVSRF